MLRYLKLYMYFLQFSFSRAMEFRLDFFFRVFMDCIFYAVQIIFFWVIYRHTNLLGGWTFDQALIFASAYMLADAINMTFFSNNTWWFPIYVNRGDLDYYLVRPVSSLYFLMLRDFAANSFMNLVIASGIMAWALARYPEPLTAWAITVFIIALLIGNLLWALMTMGFLIPVFWLHSANGLRETMWQVHRLMERPDQIFKGWLHRMLVSVLPFALIASYPTHILFNGGNDWWRFLHIVVVTLLMWLFILWFWQRGLRAYSSASS